MKALTMVVIVVLALAAGAEAALVGYWSFDEGEDIFAYDWSPNANRAWVSGMAWVPGHTGEPGDWAVEGDGTIGFVKVSDSASLDTLATSPATIAFWGCRTPGAAGPGGLVTLIGVGRRWHLDAEGVIASDADPAWNCQTGLAIVEGSWHHYAIVFEPINGCHLYVYMDGDLVDDFVVHPQSQALPAFSDSLRLAVGFDGAIDDVAVFSSIEEIGPIMDGSHPELIPEPATLALLGLGSLAMFVRRRW